MDDRVLSATSFVSQVLDRAEQVADQGLVRREGFSLPQAGGCEKPGELFTGDVSFSPENTQASGEKLEGKFIKRVESEVEGRELAELGPFTPSTDKRDDREALARLIPAPAPLGQGGRPKVLTPEVTEKLFLLLAVGFSRSQAAAYLGIDRTTITHAAAKDPEFAAELRRAQELTSLQSEMTLMAAARKNWRAAAWYLQFKAKNPPPLTEEEKEERHQAQLADQRRSAELTAEWVAGTERAMSRRSDPLSATYAKRSKKR